MERVLKGKIDAVPDQLRDRGLERRHRREQVDQDRNNDHCDHEYTKSEIGKDE